jgi:hypothetical protein
MTDQSYQEQIAQWRAERERQQKVTRLQEIQQDYAHAAQARDEALAVGDTTTAEWKDDDCKYYEQEWQELNPYRPQPHPAAVQWDWQNQDYINKVNQRVGPQRAMQGMAHVDAVAARHYPRNSPGYQKFAEDYLEMYSEGATGVKYDPKDKTPTWQDAAKASGLSEREYANSYHQLRAQGRVR